MIEERICSVPVWQRKKKEMKQIKGEDESPSGD